MRLHAVWTTHHRVHGETPMVPGHWGSRGQVHDIVGYRVGVWGVLPSIKLVSLLRHKIHVFDIMSHQ
uniref:Uncharacterized protein n=1 Tax=Ciona intestinalis TaxID=7719 RepID=H2XY18_CIOIN